MPQDSPKGADAGHNKIIIKTNQNILYAWKIFYKNLSNYYVKSIKILIVDNLELCMITNYKNNNVNMSNCFIKKSF